MQITNHHFEHCYIIFKKSYIILTFQNHLAYADLILIISILHFNNSRNWGKMMAMYG